MSDNKARDELKELSGKIFVKLTYEISDTKAVALAETFNKWIDAYTQSRVAEAEHNRVAYSPYVDTFHYWCSHYSKEDELRTTTAEVSFATDKNGDVTWLEIKQLHDNATLTDNQERRK